MQRLLKPRLIYAIFMAVLNIPIAGLFIYYITEFEFDVVKIIALILTFTFTFHINRECYQYAQKQFDEWYYILLLTVLNYLLQFFFVFYFSFKGFDAGNWTH
ncbi:MAG: hypothetical protein K1X55_15865 [Chitinophagales bacterium]|nr:hypothetical protein [Chitinophagales bacterium]